MSRNDVFVLRGIKSVNSRQTAVSVFLRMYTCVISTGDVNTIDPLPDSGKMKGC